MSGKKFKNIYRRNDGKTKYKSKLANWILNENLQGTKDELKQSSNNIRFT